MHFMGRTVGGKNPTLFYPWIHKPWSNFRLEDKSSFSKTASFLVQLKQNNLVLLSALPVTRFKARMCLAARSTTRLKNMKPASGHLMLLTHCWEGTTAMSKTASERGLPSRSNVTPWDLWHQKLEAVLHLPSSTAAELSHTHWLLPSKLPPPDQPPIHFKSHSANVLHKFFDWHKASLWWNFPTVMQNTRMSEQWKKKKKQMKTCAVFQ